MCDRCWFKSSFQNKTESSKFVLEIICSFFPISLMLVFSLHIVLHDNLMPWAITGQLILKVPPPSCPAASPQLLIWMSVFYVSTRSLINPAGFKGFAAYLWLWSSLSARRSPTPLAHSKLHRALKVCVKSAPADAGEQIHSRVCDAILREQSHWRSQGTQANSSDSL